MERKNSLYINESIDPLKYTVGRCAVQLSSVWMSKNQKFDDNEI